MSGVAARPRIALMVPSLSDDGGVPNVARFVKDAILRAGEFNLKLISLATSSVDESSVRLAQPGTWLTGVATRAGTWEGLPYVHVGAPGSELEWRRYRPRRALQDLLADCDLIQVVSGSPAWALPAIGLGKPVVLQVATRAIVERRRRASVERGPTAWWRWLMTRVTDVFDDRALRTANAVLVENPWMLRYASDIGAAHGTWVRYAPPGIDTTVFHPARERFRDASDPGYILSVGRFDDPRKNVDLLLEAFGLIHRSMDKLPHLKLVGAGDPGPKFWQRARELGLEDHVSFHFRPTLEELVAFYQDALCFALSSDEEGFGLVVAEAMSCGVPVVATRCGGPDGIVEDGVNGFLVAVGDAPAMAAGLQRLATDVAANRAMGEAARRAVETRFAQSVAGEVFLDTYRKLLAAKS